MTDIPAPGVAHNGPNSDIPSVTDDARAEAERRYPSDVADRGLTYPTGAVREHSQAAFVAGAEWAAGRAETTTTHQARLADALAQDIRRIDGDHSMGAGALGEALVMAGWTLPYPTETTTATTATDEDAALDAATEAVEAEFTSINAGSDHGARDVAEAAVYAFLGARGLLATPRTRPTEGTRWYVPAYRTPEPNSRVQRIGSPTVLREHAEREVEEYRKQEAEIHGGDPNSIFLATRLEHQWTEVPS